MLLFIQQSRFGRVVPRIFLLVSCHALVTWCSRVIRHIRHLSFMPYNQFSARFVLFRIGYCFLLNFYSFSYLNLPFLSFSVL